MLPLKQRWKGADRINLHQHVEPYVTLVLSGGYEEAGDSGRHQATAGDVLVHHAFDAHGNRIQASGAQVLNLPVLQTPQFTHGWIDDPDEIARIAERDPAAASFALMQRATARTPCKVDWPDQLAQYLTRIPNGRISDWAERQGLALATVSRGFKAAYGMSPCTFRFRVKARNAFRLITRNESSLAAVALEANFPDQAAMTRAIVAYTGITPGRWRVKNRQDRENGSG